MTRTSEAEGKHLLFSQTVTMVRAMGTGSFSKAVSSSALEDTIKEKAQFERLVTGGVHWFKVLLEHFGPYVPPGEDTVSIFTNDDYVLRAMPIKVALGVMGHAWVERNLPLQAEHRESLAKINWRVDSRWDGIAGEVSPKTNKAKNEEGKQVKVEVPEEWELASGKGKMVGALAVRALTSPSSNAGRKVRGLAPIKDDAPGDESSAA